MHQLIHDSAFIQSHGASTGLHFDLNFDDGAWHHLVLPLEDFEGVDWTQVTSPLIFIGGGGSDEERLYVDNVFYAQD